MDQPLLPDPNHISASPPHRRRENRPINKQKRTYLGIGIVSVTVILALAGVMLLKTNILADTKTKQSKDSLPSGWVYKATQACQVNLPVPPSKEPYLQKTSQGTRYWQKEEYTNEQNGLTTSIARVVFKYPNESENVINGEVLIYCSPNSHKDTTDTYYNQVTQKIKTDPNFKGLTIQQKSNLQLWGKKVDKFTAQAQNGDVGQYYFFATPNHIYLIRPVSQSTDRTVQTTLQQIFANLQFVQ